MTARRAGGGVAAARAAAPAPPVSGSLGDLPFVNAAAAPSAVVLARREGVSAAGGAAAGGAAAGGGAASGGSSRGTAWRDVTAAEFAAEVADTAKGLIEAGIEPGDRIAIMSRTRYEWTLLDFAAWAAGAVVVPIYPTASAEQAAWAIHDSAVRAIVAEDQACADVIADALGWSGVLLAPPRVWRIDEGAVEELMMRGGTVSSAELDRRRGALSPASPATIVYTSGTTGMPKGVPLTHGNFLTAATGATSVLRPVFERSRPGGSGSAGSAGSSEGSGSFEGPGGLADSRGSGSFRGPGGPADSGASTLLFLPLAHVLGRVLEITCVQARIRLGHSPSTRPADLRPDLETFGATFLAGVPYVFEKIHEAGREQARARRLGFVYDRATRVAIRYAERDLRARAGDGPGPSPGLRAARLLYETLVYRRVRAALGGRIREAICGGSALSPRLMLFFAGAGVLIYEGYGLTETTGPATVNPPGRPRPGTVGPPLPGCSVRIADDGEVLLRGPQVFSGYQPGKSAPHLASDGTGGSGWPGADGSGDVDGSGDGAGWFATGDLGRLDEDGYLTITGRKKDILITRGGKNVSPGPLEDQLRAHPVVSQCIVIGDDRPYVAALVTVDRAHLVLGALDDRAGSPGSPAAPGVRRRPGGPTAPGSPAVPGSSPAVPGSPADRGASGVPEAQGTPSAGGKAAGGKAAGRVEVQCAVPVPSTVVTEVAAAVDEVNASVSRPESIRRVRIVAGDFTRERGLLSESLKVRRQAVLDAYRPDVEALYA